MKYQLSEHTIWRMWRLRGTIDPRLLTFTDGFVLLDMPERSAQTIIDIYGGVPLDSALQMALNAAERSGQLPSKRKKET